MLSRITQGALVALALAPFGSQAFAQDASSTVRSAPLTGRTTSLEVKPLPLVANVLPGVGAVGIAGERFIDGHLAPFLQGNFATADMSQKLIGANDESATALPDRVNLWSLAAGMRYYGQGVIDSWYAGGKLGYARTEGDWVYRDERVGRETAALLPGVEGGYRWIWDSGLLVRVGGDLAANVIVGEETDAKDASDEAVDKVEAATTLPIATTFDLGVGYAF